LKFAKSDMGGSVAVRFCWAVRRPTAGSGVRKKSQSFKVKMPFDGLLTARKSSLYWPHWTPLLLR